MTASNGEVVSVNISEKKGTTKQPVDRIEIDQMGVVKDAHAGPWQRQVSLLALESIEQFGTASEREFKPGEFAENLTTKGLDLMHMPILSRLRINEVELEVTQIGKSCHGKGCAIFTEIGKCVMPKEGIFGRVISGGSIEPGAGVEFQPKVLTIKVITLSDRASRGEYSDRSGPRVVELAQEFAASTRWTVEFSTEVLPDDPQTLDRALDKAQKERFDIIFTTGGTGIGPRDITPDVVVMRCSKLMPGIMENIRIKYGADKPNALLSRAIAGVMGHSLIYTLPGSVRAVNEYMEEISRTLEHTILMLHGIDAHGH